MSLHINQLPCEIHQNIMEYLSLDDRKSTSLVCRLWNKEAFSARLQSSVQLQIPCWRSNESLSVLLNSCRFYRNVFVVFNWFVTAFHEFKFMRTLLDKLGSKVETFTVKGICPWVQLTEFLARMPNLKDLWVYAVGADSRLMEQRVQLPVLTKLYNLDVEISNDDALQTLDIQHVAPNVQHLIISSRQPHRMFEVLSVYAAQLQSVDIWKPREIRIGDLQFEKLQVLRLREPSNFSDNSELPQELPRLFHRLPLLRELYMGDYGISHSLLEIICRRCPLLISLDIRSHNLGTKSFKCLENLKNLQVLGLSTLKSNMMAQCEPMRTITELHLVQAAFDHLSYYVNQLYEVCPNVQIVTVKYRMPHVNINDVHLTSEICRKFIHLKKLTLCGKLPGKITLKGFESSNGLGNVEELTLHTVDLCFDPSFDPSFNNVRRLKLVDFNPVFWEYFEKIFPNLHFLEIRNCWHINSQMIADMQRKIPDCVVNYVRTNSFNRSREE